MNFVQNQTFDATLEARFAAAARHSRVVRVLRVAVPVAVILAMTGVVAVSIFNPFRILMPKLPVQIDNLVVSGSKITMENPHLAGFSADRRPYEVRAKAAIQDLAAVEDLQPVGQKRAIEQLDVDRLVRRHLALVDVESCLGKPGFIAG